MSKPRLERANVRALVDEGIASRVPQHVDVDGEPEAGTLTRLSHNLLCRDGCHGRTTLGHEQVFGCRLLSLQFA